jgi:LPS sulfotransferase NodH
MVGLPWRVLDAFRTAIRKPVVPFIIVGMPRTGSTVLLDCIQQHPNILAHGELFHWVRSERCGRHAIKRGDRSICFDEGEDGIDFLCREVFDCKIPGVRATGFKLFAEYVRCPGTDKLLQRMRARVPRLRIVHITRDNYLDVLISRAIARQTGIWEKRVGGAPPENRLVKVIIEPKVALESFERLKRADAFFSDLKGRRYHRVNYNDLTTDLSHELNNVFRFLGQVSFTPDVRLMKQNVRPAHEILDNYPELQDAFLGTEYSRFFQPLPPRRAGQGTVTGLVAASSPNEIVPQLAI